MLSDMLNFYRKKWLYHAPPSIYNADGPNAAFARPQSKILQLAEIEHAEE
jgi:hypothetical protein